MISQNMFVPKLEPCTLNDVVSEVCGMLNAEAGVLGMTIVFQKLQSDLKVVIDKMRTQQILINLVQNSIKYSKKDGNIQVSIATCPLPEKDTLGVVFRVRDKGVGIPPKKRARLFQPYYRAHSN